MHRLPTITMFLWGLVAFSAEAIGAEAKQQGSLIAAADGTAGVFALGDAISRFRSQVEQDAPGVYWSKDRSFRLWTDDQGKITAIETSDPFAFTEKWIRPGRSTAQQVLTTYGRPRSVALSDGFITFDYERYAFTFERTGTAARLSREDYERLLRSPVATVRLQSASSRAGR